MKKILYHGTNSFFEEFSNEFISTKESIDQYGSGFYFYDSPAKTIMHGDLRVTAEVEILKSVEHTKMWNPSCDIIHSLICASPNLGHRLGDHGDIGYYGFDIVLNRAIKLYAQKSFYTHILNTIGNDFFDGNETHILLNKFIELSGINCIKDSKRGIYVILAKRFIDIKSVVHEQEWEEL